MLKKIILPLWILAGIFLFLYSFTQVDLSLTLSQASIFQEMQKGFQYIGWFDRPLSTYLYLGLLVYLFTLFLITLRYISKNTLSTKIIWAIIIYLAVVLTPSYNAFSYDLFNYVFDARIVTHYSSNPYEFRALDFPEDPMLSFMRSTHRVYPYGPFWLGLTVPLTFLGNEIFALNLILFKSISSLSFLGTAYFIKKISENLKFKNTSLAISLFALNPLVLIEGLVSSHNEIVMMLFAISALYLLISNKKILSLAPLIVSIGVKFSTLIFAPVFLLKFFIKEMDNKKTLEYAIILSFIAVVITSLASGQNKNPEFQPWYLLLSAPLVGLVDKKIFRFIFIVLSFFALLSYVPFLYTGLWPENIVMLKNILLIAGLSFGILFYYVNKVKVVRRFFRI